MCPLDSRDAYPTVKRVLKKYEDSVHFILHLFPLPYHRNAFLAAQSLKVIAAFNSSAVFDWVDVYFENFGLFTNQATADLSFLEIAQSIQIIASHKVGISRDEFLAGVQPGTDFDFETRTSWKYACSRGITGAPVFLLNGVKIDADESWTEQQWHKLLSPFLPSRSS
jgi:hypothetical protein